MIAHSISFENWEALLDYVASRPADCQGESRCSLDSGDDALRFRGTATMAEAVHLARYGWPEGRERMAAMRARINSVVAQKAHRPQAVYSVAGESVDIGRYLSGEPECMVEWQQEEATARGKIIRLALNASTSQAIRKDDLFLRGAAACALVDALENAGFSVEVSLAWCSSSINTNNKVQIFTVVKRAGEASEIDKLAFVLAHASTQRRFLFGVLENQSASFREEFDISHSRIGTKPSDMEVEAEIRIGKMLLGHESEAVAWVIDQLKNQGVEIEG
jgi:hypothetical protein